MSIPYSLPEITSLKNPDQSYIQQIRKLEREVKAIKCICYEHPRRACLLLAKFAENYLMPPEYWDEYLSKRYQDVFNIYLPAYQFYHPGNGYSELWKPVNASEEKIVSNPRRNFLKIFNEENETNDRKNELKKNLDSLIDGLQYPNCLIDEIWALYESESSTFPPKNIVEIYEKMRNLYFKIKTAEENTVFEWLNALLEVEDDEFVIDNVEYRLGKDLTNKMLWKLYIKFWEKRDKKIMLHTYSKFCRIFIEQKSIKAAYENEVKKYGTPFSVPWKNPFPFEIYDKNFNYDIYPRTKPPKKQHQKPLKPIRCYFTPENVVLQKFPFRSTFIKYIFDFAKPFLKQKLHFSCKYFFIQNPTIICYKLIIQKNHDPNSRMINFYENTVTVDPLCKFNFKKIYISTVLKFSASENPLALSAFIPKIAKCDAKYVAIGCQNLTLNELKIVIGHGGVEDILLHNVQVYDEGNGSEVLMENIFELTPKIKKIRLPSYPVTTTFFESLICVQFENKLTLLEFQNVRGENFDANIFLEFLMAKISPKSKIDFFFKFSNEHALDQMYDVARTHDIKAKLESLFGKDEAPEYRCNYTIG